MLPSPSSSPSPSPSFHFAFSYFMLGEAKNPPLETEEARASRSRPRRPAGGARPPLGVAQPQVPTRPRAPWAAPRARRREWPSGRPTVRVAGAALGQVYRSDSVRPSTHNASPGLLLFRKDRMPSAGTGPEQAVRRRLAPLSGPIPRFLHLGPTRPTVGCKLVTFQEKLSSQAAPCEAGAPGLGLGGKKELRFGKGSPRGDTKKAAGPMRPVFVGRAVAASGS